MYDPRGVGQRIRDHRRALGLSQEDLAEAIDRASNGSCLVRQSTVSKWEGGTHIVALRNRGPLARALHVQIVDLFRD